MEYLNEDGHLTLRSVTQGYLEAIRVSQGAVRSAQRHSEANSGQFEFEFSILDSNFSFFVSDFAMCCVCVCVRFTSVSCVYVDTDRVLKKFKQNQQNHC